MSRSREETQPGCDPSIIGTGPRALYVHGLLMTGLEGTLLLRRLRRAGIAAGVFAYGSRRESPARAAARLAERLRRDPGLCLVGHSLGGLLAVDAIAAVPQWRGRAVLLGAPLAGSATARRLLTLPGGSWWLGAARARLTGTAVPSVPRERTAVVAGTRNLGVGRLLGAFGEAGDGVVRLDETRIPGVAAREFRVNHVELLFARGVASAVAAFIREGRWPGP